MGIFLQSRFPLGTVILKDVVVLHPITMPAARRINRAPLSMMRPLCRICSHAWKRLRCMRAWIAWQYNMIMALSQEIPHCNQRHFHWSFLSFHPSRAGLHKGNRNTGVRQAASYSPKSPVRRAAFLSFNDSRAGCYLTASSSPGTCSAPTGTVMDEPAKSSPTGSCRPPRHLARKASVTA